MRPAHLSPDNSFKSAAARLASSPTTTSGHTLLRQPGSFINHIANCDTFLRYYDIDTNTDSAARQRLCYYLLHTSQEPGLLGLVAETMRSKPAAEHISPNALAHAQFTLDGLRVIRDAYIEHSEMSDYNRVLYVTNDVRHRAALARYLHLPDRVQPDPPDPHSLPATAQGNEDDGPEYTDDNLLATEPPRPPARPTPADFEDQRRGMLQRSLSLSLTFSLKDPNDERQYIPPSRP